MIPAASEASDEKLAELAAHQRRETIKRRGAGEPVREIALLSLMEPIPCATAYDPANPGGTRRPAYAAVGAEGPPVDCSICLRHCSMTLPRNGGHLL